MNHQLPREVQVMKRTVLPLLLVLSLFPALSARAQTARLDAIWARTTTDTIVLDGILDEAAWAAAETWNIQWGQDAGIPGSGFKVESGHPTSTDPTNVTLRFLIKDNQLYLGAYVPDASVGGAAEFNRFDGLLMSMKDHSYLDAAPKPTAEYLYSWWFPESAPDPQPTGQLPAFIGSWAEWPPGTPRTQEQIDNWDAVTVVDGLTNSDAADDQGYTVEMRFNLTPMGYDTTSPEGDIVEWGISIYDCDWFWPIDPLRFTVNRVWWQSPWGNTGWYNEVRIHGRPDVTTSSGPVPTIDPEFVLNELATASIVMDGALTEPEWNDAKVFNLDIRYGDAALRASYPGVASARAGQYQPEVNGGAAFVLDPGDATVKAFFKGTRLYLGFDVNDMVVQYHPDFNRWDGFLVSINDRAERGPDNQLLGQRLSFQVDWDGSALAQDYLNTLVLQGDAEVEVSLKSFTTVDTMGTSPDIGYTAEMYVDLTQLGYPFDLGDEALFLGINLLDGDSFLPITDSYGTRTWWFREYPNDCCAAWVHLAKDPATAANPAVNPSQAYYIIKNFPNPSLKTTIQYSLAQPSDVLFEVFDVRGRLVERREVGTRGSGANELLFDGTDQSAGLYLYRLRVMDPGSRSIRADLQGKFMLVK